MSGLGRCAIAPGLLTAFLVVACTGAGAADHASDSPESRLRARIADLHADVELLKVECAAARHNLLECLKQSGKLELGDRKVVLSEIENEMRKGLTMPFVDSNDALKKVQHDIEIGRIKGEKEQIKLMAELEFQGRLDSARAESDRRKADFLKKIRSLHQKKQELAEAEAEYKSSR